MQRGLDGVGKQFQRALLFGGKGKHGGRDIEDHIDERAHLLAIELHRVGAGAGVGLPVDLAWIVAGQVEAMVLEVETTAGAAAEKLTRMAAPALLTEGQLQHARPATCADVQRAQCAGIFKQRHDCEGVS